MNLEKTIAFWTAQFRLDDLCSWNQVTDLTQNRCDSLTLQIIFGFTFDYQKIIINWINHCNKCFFCILNFNSSMQIKYPFQECFSNAYGFCDFIFHFLLFDELVSLENTGSVEESVKSFKLSNNDILTKKELMNTLNIIVGSTIICAFSWSLLHNSHLLFLFCRSFGIWMCFEEVFVCSVVMRAWELRAYFVH